MSLERPPIVNAHGIVKALVDYQAEHDRVVQENRTLRTRLAKLEETSVHPDIVRAVFPKVAYATTTAVVREIERLKAAAAGTDLSGAIARMNDVITAQIEVLGTNSGIARAADIRRRQVAKYPLEHDREHGSLLLERASAALAMFHAGAWPWGVGQYTSLTDSPDRLAHAAALACAAYDVARYERGEGGER